MKEHRAFDVKVCPKWNCHNCLLFDTPDLPCAKHGLKMVEDTELRRKYRHLRYRIKYILRG